MDLDCVEAGTPRDLADALAARFESVHGRRAQGVYAAPGRVNLIGEHTDYNGGLCLPVALPHATYVAVAPRDDDRVSLASTAGTDSWTGSLDDLGPDRTEGWAAYSGGVLWAMRQAGFAVPGLDLLVDSRVPLGAGLSSSAALECAVALAVCGVGAVDVDDDVRRDLVRSCMRAESDVAGAPTGGMDQTIAMFGRADHALLLDCRDWSTRQVRWDPAEAGLRLVVIDTRASHSLTDGGYGSRREECERAAQLLGVAELRELEDAADLEESLARLDDEVLRRRVRHVVSEIARVRAAVGQVEADDFAALGATFAASHASMRDDYEISCEELDVAVAVAVDHGALGARMTGGGFGGSAIALVPDAAVEAVEQAVAAAYDERGWEVPGFLDAPPSPGARGPL